MGDFIDRTLIKLKRQYSKDEVIAALIKQLSEKDIELGMFKSEIDHLQHELQKQIAQKEVNSAAKIEVRKDELYKIQLETNRKQREKIRQLIHDRNDLIAKNYFLLNKTNL